MLLLYFIKLWSYNASSDWLCSCCAWFCVIMTYGFVWLYYKRNRKHPLLLTVHTVKALLSPCGAYLILDLKKGGIIREVGLIEGGGGGLFQITNFWENPH